MTNITMEDLQAALALLAEQKAPVAVAPAPARTEAAKPGRRTLSEADKAKMAEGRKRAAAARKAAATEPAKPAATVPDAKPAKATTGEFTITSPHGDMKFTAHVNKNGAPYVLMHVHDGFGGAVVLHSVDHMKRMFWPMRTCDKDQLVGLMAFMDANKRK